MLALLGTGCRQDVASGDPGGTTDHAERRRITAFWEAYREATRLRLAGDYERSLAAYQEALSRDSLHEDALYYMGNVALELGKGSVAERAWRTLTAINPSSTRAYIQLGNIHMCDPSAPGFDLSTAARYFREAIRLNREETGALLRLGQAHLVNGNPDSAVLYFDNVLASDPSSREARFGRAYADWRIGDESGVRFSIDNLGGSVSDEETKQFSGEGDTRGGRGGPMLAPGTRCLIFDSLFERFAVEKPGRAEVIGSFEVLAERIARAGS